MELPDVRDGDAIVFLTGAGMSVESGVPASPPHGAWDLGSVCQEDFEFDPEAVWALHDELRAHVRACEPHAGHHAIARLQRARPDVAVITTTVDGLHQRAGVTGVIELHGSLWRVRCPHCLAQETCEAVPRARLRCEHCLGWWRPDVVWMGDAVSHRLRAMADHLARSCDVMVVVGVSGRVFPAASLPELAREAGARCVEINPQETPLSRLCQHHLRAPASEGLARLVRAAGLTC